MNLWRYIEGDRKGTEAHRIEKEAMKDPFLADALEGYTKTPGNHQRKAARLQQETIRKQKRLTTKSANRKTIHLIVWSFVAVGILVAAGIAGWFLPGSPPQQIPPASPPVEKNRPVVVAPQTQTVQDSVAVLPEEAPATPPVTPGEELPQPVTGMQAYMEYIRRNMKRPTDDECRDVKGAVVVTFEIGQSGRPYNIKVTEGLCASINKEAIRLIIHGPDWKKGRTSNESAITINF